MPFFEVQDPENRIREVQLVHRKVVPRLFDPPDRWNKAIFLLDEFQEPKMTSKTVLNDLKTLYV